MIFVVEVCFKRIYNKTNENIYKKMQTMKISFKDVIKQNKVHKNYFKLVLFYDKCHRKNISKFKDDLKYGFRVN